METWGYSYTMRSDARDYRVQLIPVGDIHAGNAGHDRHYFENFCKWMRKQKDLLWIGMGDYADGIVHTDRRWDWKSLDFKTLVEAKEKNITVVDAQYRQLRRSLFEPLADKCLGLHTGNHDDLLRKLHEHDFVQDICERHDIPYLGWTALGRLSFRNPKGTSRWYQDIYSTHGHYGGCALYRGAKVMAIERQQLGFDADIYLQGHVHVVDGFTDSRLGLNAKGRLEERKQVFGLTGSFLKAYIEGESTYAEQKTYKPLRIGTLKIKFYPRRHDVHLSM